MAENFSIDSFQKDIRVMATYGNVSEIALWIFIGDIGCTHLGLRYLRVDISIYLIHLYMPIELFTINVNITDKCLAENHYFGFLWTLVDQKCGQRFSVNILASRFHETDSDKSAFWLVTWQAPFVCQNRENINWEMQCSQHHWRNVRFENLITQYKSRELISLTHNIRLLMNI